jgi:hypothetical protein
VSDPDYYSIISRATVERLSKGDDAIARWALEMISSSDEEDVFLRGARSYFERADQTKRRKALWFLASTFEADRAELKRYLRFKGKVNLTD